MPNAVIGRIAIDNIAVAEAKKRNMTVVDITKTGHHIHQGIDNNRLKNISHDDKLYNIQFLRKYINHTKVLYNADFELTKSEILK